jgi:hypothetical protein
MPAVPDGNVEVMMTGTGLPPPESILIERTREAVK